MESAPIVLCVDDDNAVLSAVRLALSAGLGRSVQLELTQNGAEAVALARELQAQGETIAVVIADYIMPGMYGDELLVQLHQLDARMVKILLTGQSNLDGVKRAINEAALFRFIEKPFDNVDLVMTVQSALHTYQQARTLERRTEELEQINHNLERLVIERTAALTESNRQLAALARTDPLTQLHNRLHLDTVLHEAMERNQRYGVAVSLIVLDIDHFKMINDTHGHNIGDVVLVQVAALLRSRMREVDVMGRWGGEEFLVICTDTVISGAAALAQSLRAALQDHTFPAVGRVTCSLGVAQLQAGEPLEDWIARADAALYRSKADGRNRVTLSE